MNAKTQPTDEQKAAEAEAEAAAKAEAQAEADAKKSKGKTVKVRVLLDCAHGKCNTVAELSPEVAKQAEKEGLVDTDAKAVAAAEAEQPAKEDK